MKWTVTLVFLALASGCASFWKPPHELWVDKFEETCTNGIGRPAAQVTRGLGEPHSDKKLTCGEVPCEEVEYLYASGPDLTYMRLVFAPHEDGTWKLAGCWTRTDRTFSWTKFPFRPGS
jgi:hypothetical protein